MSRSVSRRAGEANRPRSHERAGSSPREAAPCARNTPSSAVRVASASAAVAPSNVATARHPRIRVKCPPRAAFVRVSVSSLTRRTVGRMPRCVASRKAAVAAAKVGEGPRAVRRDGGDRADPHGDLGQHAEGALRAEEQLPQVGAGGARGRAPELQFAGGGGHPQGVHQVVEPAVPAGGLAARPRRRVPAERGVLEALREVPEGVAARAEQLLGLRPGRPGAEGREQRRLVEVDEGRGGGEVERDRPARMPSPPGSTPPTTLVPPPNGTTAMRRSSHTARTASTSSCDDGKTTASGAVCGSSRRRARRSGVLLPPRCSIRTSSSRVTAAAPMTATSRRGRRRTAGRR